MPTTAILYLRKSNAPGEANNSFALQEELCRACAAQAGYQVREVLRETESAFREDVRREQFEELLMLIEAKATDVVVVRDLDRLTRQHLDLARVFSAAERAGVTVHVANGDVRYHPGDASSRIMAELMTSLASAESRRTGQRILSDRRKRREHGWLGGGTPYGWKPERAKEPGADGRFYVRLVQDGEEIRAVERMRQLVMDENLPLTAVYKTLNKEGYKTRKGGMWNSAAIQRTLSNPALAGGVRSEEGAPRHGTPWWLAEPLRHSDGTLVQLAEPLMTEVEWLAVKRKVAPKSRKERHRRASGVLLAGLVYCGECGGHMYGSSQKSTRGDGREVIYTRYTCGHASRPNSSGKICTNSISGGAVDEFVRRYMTVLYKSGVFRDALAQRRRTMTRAENRYREVRQDIHDAGVRLDRLVVALEEAENSHSRAALSARIEATGQEIAALEARRDAMEAEGEGFFMTEEEILQVAQSLNPDQARRAIESVIDRVVIDRAPRVYRRGVSQDRTSRTDLGRIRLIRGGQEFSVPDGWTADEWEG